MIRFKVIKLGKQRLFFLIAIMLVFIIFLVKSYWNISVKPVFSQVNNINDKPDKSSAEKSLSIFDYFNKNAKIQLKLLNTQLIEKMLTLSVPAMDKSEKGLKFFSINDTVNRLLYLTTNIDFSAPESIFCIEIPAAKILKTEMTMTPGVEIIPEKEAEHILNSSNEEEDLYSNIEKINKLNNKDPLVLIFHTHTTESYTPSKKFKYELKDKSYHTEDLNFTVAKVGEYLTKELNDLGVPTMHNKTVHDVPTYMTSYGNSLKTVRKTLKENPSIRVVIDLHRDAPVKSSKKSREITTVKIDGKTYSRVMFVVGTDKTFPHPHWKENYKFCTLLNKKLEERYPGISRGLDIRKERFNQHLSKKAMLIEIGSHGNTIEESINTTKILAEVLADVLKEISKNDIH